ncbi:MAG: PadR family transcriptional regulator [Syntrophomonadaceae bacterium]|jgi:PadR family transcriptional regulator PadR
MVKVNKELIRGSTAIMVLSLLSQDDMYGYQIIKEINKQSGGVFVFKEGTLYPILHALEAEGSVESYWVESNQGRRRKYYRITSQGTNILKEKSAEWNQFKKAVDQVIGGMKLEPVPEP